MPSCAILTCRKQSKSSNVTHGNISFHRFPSEINTKLKWIDATGRMDWVPTKLSTICSIHFSDDVFEIKKSGRRYLKTDAVPTKEIVMLCSGPSETSQSNLPSTSTVNSTTLKRQSMSTDSYSPVNSNTSTPRKKKLKTIITSKDSIIKRQRLQIKKIQAQNRRLKKKIIKMQEVFENLKNKFMMRTEDLHALENINLPIHELVKRVTEKDDSGVKSTTQYPPALGSFALTLHYYSPKAYNYVRETFNTCLPHPQTIKKWYQSISGDPGFTSESLEALKQKAETTNYPVYANLVLDEMAIRRSIEWDGEKMHVLEL